MIRIEGTSPPNGDNPTQKNQNASHLPSISNTIQAILPQSSTQTNNDQQSDDNKFPQSKNNIIDDNKINSAFQNEQKSNNINDQENGEKYTSEQETNSNLPKGNTEGTENINNTYINEDDSKTENGNNENNKEDSNEGNDNLENNNDNEAKIKDTNSNNENKDEEEDGKETENTNNENKDEKKTELINNNSVNIEDNNQTKAEDTNNDNEQSNQTNEQQSELANNNNNGEEEEEKTLNSNRSINSNTSKKSNFSNKPFSFYMIRVDPKEVEDSLESLMTRNIQPTEQLRDPVMQLINRKKLDALIQRDYDLAEKYEQTASTLQKSGDDLLFERNERIRKLTIDDRSDSISEKIKNVQQKYNKKIDDIKTERKTSIENLQSQHEIENSQFRQKWQDPNFLSKYKHPSQELIQLRLMEKRLALSKFYDEAKEKKIWADKQQKIEEKQMQTVIEGEMKKEFFRMKDSQYLQLKKLTDHYDSLIKSLELQKNKEIQSMQYALKQMEVKKNTVPNRKLHTIPQELCQMNNNDTDTSLTAKMSPRTLSRLAQFRNEKKGKINVSPIADSAFSKLIAAHPIVRPQSKFKVNNHPPSRMRKL